MVTCSSNPEIQNKNSVLPEKVVMQYYGPIREKATSTLGTRSPHNLMNLPFAFPGQVRQFANVFHL